MAKKKRPLCPNRKNHKPDQEGCHLQWVFSFELDKFWLKCLICGHRSKKRSLEKLLNKDLYKRIYKSLNEKDKKEKTERTKIVNIGEEEFGVSNVRYENGRKIFEIWHSLNPDEPIETRAADMTERVKFEKLKRLKREFLRGVSASKYSETRNKLKSQPFITISKVAEL